MGINFPLTLHFLSYILDAPALRNEHHYSDSEMNITISGFHTGRGKGTILLINQPKSWHKLCYENVRVFSKSPGKIICNHFGHLCSVKNCIT